ncbi:ParB/Srx family N-terminal domain-containing protein [Streptomyces griseus]|uniref:ParB/Srx family N-terminal domain-containing protein n=1 Tax=Streptomyces griseus TaxID=1911 RepID=UPI0034220819
MDITRVPMDRIDAGSPLRPLPADLSRMADSIRVDGLAQPLLVAHEDMRIISGYTRYFACRQLEKSDVEVVVVRDVVQAASYLGTHVTDPDPVFATQMDAATRFELFLRILNLGRPTDLPADQRMDCASVAAGVTGFSDRTIRCLRRARRRTQIIESKDAVGDSTDAAVYFAAMLHVCDNPPPNMTSHGAVQFLFGKMRSGASPEFLKEITSGSNKLKSEKGGTSQERRPSKRVQKNRKDASTRRMEKNMRLGVENISGALEGLESLLWSHTLEPETKEYLNLEFNRQVKKIQKIQQKISRRSDESIRA